MSDSSLEIDGHLAQLSVSSDHPITFQGISCVVASHIDSIFIWTTTMFSREMLESLQSVTGSVTFCGNRHMHMNRKWQQLEPDVSSRFPAHEDEPQPYMRRRHERESPPRVRR